MSYRNIILPVLYAAFFAAAFLLGTSELRAQTAINASVVENEFLIGINDMSLDGDVLYVSCYNWLISMDVSNPGRPVALDTLEWFDWDPFSQVPDWFRSTALYGGYFYGATQDHGIKIFDVSDPRNLAVADSFFLPIHPAYVDWGFMYTWKHYLMVRSNTADMFVYDLSTPVIPKLVHSYWLPLQSMSTWDATYTQTQFRNDTIFIVTHDTVEYNEHVKIGTLRNDGSIDFLPIRLRDEFGDWPYFGAGFCVSDSLMILSQTADSMSIFSISDIRQPRRLSKIGVDYLSDIKMFGNELYAIAADSRFFKYDLTNPGAPVLASYYINRMDGSYYRTQMIEDYAYITSGSAGLRILRLGENTAACAIEAPGALAAEAEKNTPNPFNLTYTLTNTGNAQLDVAAIGIQMPSSITTTDPLTQSVSPLAPSAHHDITWSLTALTSSYDREAIITVFSEDAEGNVLSSCVHRVFIPGVDALDCGTSGDVSVVYDPVLQEYQPNPFEHTLTVYNYLDSALTNVEAAAMISAPYIGLAGMTNPQSTAAIPMGGTWPVTWQFKVQQKVDTQTVVRITYRIRSDQYPTWRILGECRFTVTILPEPLGVDDPPAPEAPALHEIYPNPFSGSTSISYSLPTQEHIVLEVYNMLGQKVQTLYNGLREPGVHTARLDASVLPAGTYRVALRSGSGVRSEMVVVR